MKKKHASIEIVRLLSVLSIMREGSFVFIHRARRPPIVGEVGCGVWVVLREGVAGSGVGLGGYLITYIRHVVIEGAVKQAIHGLPPPTHSPPHLSLSLSVLLNSFNMSEV